MGRIYGRQEMERYERWLTSPWGRLATGLECELILSLLEPRLGERLLDIGCGVGTHLELFRHHGLDVTGLDASAEMLEAARLRLGPGVPLHKGFAEHLPFEDGEFDVCTLITSLEFMADPAQALAEAARVARRRILVGLLNPCSAHGLRCRLRGLCGDGLYRRARLWSPWAMRRLIRRTLGPWPLRWRSVLVLPAALCCRAPRLERRLCGANPFGAFVAMTVDLTYRYRAAELPLQVAAAARNRSLAGVGLHAEGVTPASA